MASITQPQQQQQPPPQQQFHRMDLILEQLHFRFLEFQQRYIGDEISVFRRLPITKKSYSNATVNIHYGEHITTGLIPFALPRNGQILNQISPDLSIFDALQYYMDGVASLIVAKTLDTKHDRFDKSIKIYWSVSLNAIEKLNNTGIIYSFLRHICQLYPEHSEYVYSLGTFCYSYFKLHQNAHQISAIRFFNQPRDRTIDLHVYSKMHSLLKESNKSFLIEMEKQPSQTTDYWFIYAKTCCLLDIEEKAQSWIQLYINNAFDRIKLAKIVASDQDVEPYHTKSWYKEIMQSVELEEVRRVKEEQAKMEQQRVEREQQMLLIQQQEEAMKQLQNLAIADQFEIIPSAADQYQEIKQSLICDGYSPKNMNNDALLISSVILLSMTQPKEAKEAEAAKKRLNDRLDLYMLKNSKEIPGDD
ncbi:OTU domain containing protein [Heterostelium album PN500]|uniref:OTU domain containing protein n=1 Tax=Heterostelium pallidum (strain ATCC 26659 / Pp 5 / PN500) TaxID=670386 RepID=D3B8T7_HETP5|nr:OTU domain containing protein [Heterostelium album PN500]EFA82455.1 OTU domain containing protein [Heterostelium album PN500]|eukprot:XP_020434572.1 OTU domain containing protein [Heterostelium album PN500]